MDGPTRPGGNTCAGVDQGVLVRDDSEGDADAYGASVTMADVIGIDLCQRLGHDLNQRRCGNDRHHPARADIQMIGCGSQTSPDRCPDHHNG